MPSRCRVENSSTFASRPGALSKASTKTIPVALADAFYETAIDKGAGRPGSGS